MVPLTLVQKACLHAYMVSLALKAVPVPVFLSLSIVGLLKPLFVPFVRKLQAWLCKRFVVKSNGQYLVDLLLKVF